MEQRDLYRTGYQGTGFYQCSKASHFLLPFDPHSFSKRMMTKASSVHLGKGIACLFGQAQRERVLGSLSMLAVGAAGSGGVNAVQPFIHSVGTF